MEANELRIGNYVEFSTPDLPINIKQLFHKVTAKDIVNFEEGKILLEPAVLTEEILLKAEFETDGYVYSKNGFHVGLFIGGRFIHLPTNQIAVQGREIKFLHELQNGYYWHKNEELIFNL